MIILLRLDPKDTNNASVPAPSQGTIISIQFRAQSFIRSILPLLLTRSPSYVGNPSTARQGGAASKTGGNISKCPRGLSAYIGLDLLKLLDLY